MLIFILRGISAPFPLVTEQVCFLPAKIQTVANLFYYNVKENNDKEKPTL